MLRWCPRHPQSIRLITYLHSGPRVRGLKRDPASYLKSPKGISYTNVNLSEYKSEVQKALQFEKCGIDLPENLVLQCFTHKSFAHGSKPYNEKLNVLGSQFLKYQAAVHSLRQKGQLSSTASNKVQQPLNGLNFTNLGTAMSKLIISKTCATEFIKVKGLDSLIFWKMRDAVKDGHYNGEYTVFTSVLNALIGAVLINNGQKKAVDFVQKILLNGEGDDINLTKIAKQRHSSQPLSPKS